MRSFVFLVLAGILHAESALVTDVGAAAKKSHAIPLDISGETRRFPHDQPFGVRSFPNATGLSSSFPSYCSLTIP